MKKIIGIVVLVVVAVAGYMGLKTFNMGEKIELTSYLSDDVGFVMLSDYTNKDVAKLEKEMIDKLMAMEDFSEEEKENIKEGMEDRKEMSKYVTKMVVAGRYNLVDISEAAQMYDMELFELLATETSILIQTNFSESAISKNLEKAQDEDMEIKKIDDKTFNISITDEILENPLTGEQITLNFVAKIDGSNIILAETAAKVDELIGNKEKTTTNPLIARIKENPDDLFVFGGYAQEGQIVFTELNYANNNFDLDVEIKGAPVVELGKIYFSHNGEDNLSGKRKLQKNKLNLRITGDPGILAYSPAVVVNGADIEGEKEIEIAKNQFLYLDLDVNSDFYVDLNGYLEEDVLSLEMILNKDVLLNIFDEAKMEQASKDMQTIM